MRSAGLQFKDIAAKVSLPTRTVRNWHYKRLMKLAGVTY
jgi:DNA-binding NarL/FixJ family response regulator